MDRRWVVAFATTLLAGCASGCASNGGAGDTEDLGHTSEAITRVCGALTNGAVQGYDVSVYQGNFDWAAAKASGRSFGYARISDGLGAVDGTFAGNWASMKAAGVLRGAYQFFEPGEDEVAQANLVTSRVGHLGDGDLPVMLDMEVTGGQAPATIAAKARHWLQIVEQATGKKPLIYTGAYFWEDNVRDTSFGSYGLVIAAYGPTCPSVPNGWSNWLFWQYSDGGGQLDHDVFNGSAAQLAALAGAGGPTYPELVASSPVDVNGDGQGDVCGRAAKGVLCELSNGTGFAQEIVGPDWSDAKGWNRPEYGSTIRFGDVNGDGKADVCGRAALGVVCEIADGNGFPQEIAGPKWSDDAGWVAPERYGTMQVADVNGDGKADLCARSDKGIVCAPSKGDGFDAEVAGPAWSDANGWANPQYWSTIRFPDIDGDGKSDVCGRAAAGIVCNLSTGTAFGPEVAGPAWSDAASWNKPEYASTIRFADIDGDGKTDVCGRSSAGIECHLSTGNGFGPAIAGPAWSDASGWNHPEFYETLRVLDVDGDGKADLCARAAAGIVCSISTGSGFGPEIPGPKWSNDAKWNAPEYYGTIGSADVNHDGKDDLCARGPGGVTCATSTGAGFADEAPGPAWSDANGWNQETYYGSIRYAGTSHLRSAPGGPDGPGGAAGGGGAGAGQPAYDNPAQAGGGCAVAPGTRARGDASPGVWLALGVAVAAAAGARRRRKRAKLPAPWRA